MDYILGCKSQQLRAGQFAITTKVKGMPTAVSSTSDTVLQQNRMMLTATSGSPLFSPSSIA